MIHFFVYRKHQSIHLPERVVSPQLLWEFHLEEWGTADLWSNLSIIYTSLCLVSSGFFCRSGSISRGFRGEFKHWQIVPGQCEPSPVMANQFSVMTLLLQSIYKITSTFLYIITNIYPLIFTIISLGFSFMTPFTHIHIYRHTHTTCLNS